MPVVLVFLWWWVLLLLSPPHQTLILCLNQEGVYLHQAKLSLDDPAGVLDDWNPRDPSPCHWPGVSCSHEAHAHASVVSVHLPSSSLAGQFPSSLCRLPRLSSLVLSDNSINSSLPSSLSSCSFLSHLDLSENLLTGPLPESLSALPLLRFLDLSGNNFSGSVPKSFAEFPSLEALSLVSNLLDGPFPSFLFNVSSLRQLNLSFNSFQAAPLSPAVADLVGLEKLWLSNCGLVGPIPDALGRLSNLTTLDLSDNGLTGTLPSSLLDGLSSIVQIELYGNSLTGELPPTGWANLASLRLLDVSMNQLTGTIPDELARLPLASLNLYENRLEGPLPASIAQSPNLVELKLFGNRLSGELPSDLGEKSPLSMIDVTGNLFSGQIPATLCAKGQLEQLLLLNNSFSGEIPETLGRCWTLERVRLGNNNLSGDVPIGFWGLPHVSLLELPDNSLTGTISKAIASASNLSELTISNNRFWGQIPDEIGSLKNLMSFQGSGNGFTGSLPQSIVELDQLGMLDLHNNDLSGVLPTGIASLQRLNDLNLANNAFTGEIPAEIGSLTGLNYLDLAGNQLSGKVPMGLQDLKLNQLNLSNNRLSGPLPPLFAKEMYKSSFLGNPGLCRDIAGLCEGGGGGDSSKGYLLWMLIFVLAGLILIVGLACFYCKYRKFKEAKSSGNRSKWTLVSFHKLGFDEYEIMDSLEEDNVIGSGGSGKVYKAVLASGEAVAVKKLSETGNKAEAGDGCDVEKGGFVKDDGFEAEVETLGKIRHKNIVKLWCCCIARDCKLLVYEYMPNGSLGDLLHSSKGGMLDWPMRYRIALDAAEGLSYLHHDCVPPIVHRDIKSNNILLDCDFGARLADFGVAKVVQVTGKGPKSMSVIAGSCGYIAPEYAYTLRVNEKSDIYSFGVVILELITGKRPVGHEYGDKDLVKWVCTTLDQKGVDEILDTKLASGFKDEMCKVLNIGLVCTSPLPINRPSMRRVVKMLQEARCCDNDLNSGKKDGRLTPYYHEEPSDQVV